MLDSFGANSTKRCDHCPTPLSTFPQMCLVPTFVSSFKSPCQVLCYERMPHREAAGTDFKNLDLGTVEWRLEIDVFHIIGDVVAHQQKKK